MFSPKGSKYFTHWNTINGFRAILRQLRISKRVPVVIITIIFFFYKNQWKRYPLGQWFGEGFEGHRQGQTWDCRANSSLDTEGSLGTRLSTSTALLLALHSSLGGPPVILTSQKRKSSSDRLSYFLVTEMRFVGVWSPPLSSVQLYPFQLCPLVS